MYLSLDNFSSLEIFYILDSRPCCYSYYDVSDITYPNPYYGNDNIPYNTYLHCLCTMLEIIIYKLLKIKSNCHAQNKIF